MRGGPRLPSRQGHSQLSPTLAYKARGYSGVDCKSTIIRQWFSLLRLNILLNHFIGHIARADRQIAARPEVPPPKLLAQMREFLQHQPRADPFEPLHDLTDVLMRLVLQKHMDMVARHFARDNLQLMLQGNLPQDVSHPEGYLPR